MNSNFTPANEDEKQAVAMLKRCGFAPASWDKRFVRQLRDAELTDKERPQVWRLFIKYRRQIACEMVTSDRLRLRTEQVGRYQALLHLAATLAAPDFRKLNAARISTAPAKA